MERRIFHSQVKVHTAASGEPLVENPTPALFKVFKFQNNMLSYSLAG